MEIYDDLNCLCRVLLCFVLSRASAFLLCFFDSLGSTGLGLDTVIGSFQSFYVAIFFLLCIHFMSELLAVVCAFFHFFSFFSFVRQHHTANLFKSSKLLQFAYETIAMMWRLVIWCDVRSVKSQWYVPSSNLDNFIVHQNVVDLWICRWWNLFTSSPLNHRTDKVHKNSLEKRMLNV